MNINIYHIDIVQTQRDTKNRRGKNRKKEDIMSASQTASEYLGQKMKEAVNNVKEGLKKTRKEGGLNWEQLINFHVTITEFSKTWRRYKDKIVIERTAMEKIMTHVSKKIKIAVICPYVGDDVFIRKSDYDLADGLRKKSDRVLENMLSILFFMPVCLFLAGIVAVTGFISNSYFLAKPALCSLPVLFIAIRVFLRKRRRGAEKALNEITDGLSLMKIKESDEWRFYDTSYEEDENNRVSFRFNLSEGNDEFDAAVMIAKIKAERKKDSGMIIFAREWENEPPVLKISFFPDLEVSIATNRFCVGVITDTELIFEREATNGMSFDAFFNDMKDEIEGLFEDQREKMFIR